MAHRRRRRRSTRSTADVLEEGSDCLPNPSTQPMMTDQLGDRSDEATATSPIDDGAPLATGVAVPWRRPDPRVDRLPMRRVGEPGDMQADFRLVDRLGLGGMATVDVAVQCGLERSVALKRLLPKRQEREDLVQRFLREALVLGSFEHPAIVPVYELAVDQHDQPFYTMQIVRGRTWREIIDKRSRQKNLTIFRQVAEALAHAHQYGIIHRDLKPSNIMITASGRVALLDWGLAAALHQDSPAFPLNAANAVCGTVGYMAPEVAAARLVKIGIASDIYQLGGLLFRLITGRPPHPVERGKEGLKLAADNVFNPVGRDEPLLRVAYLAMTTDPDERPGSVEALLETVDVVAN